MGDPVATEKAAELAAKEKLDLSKINGSGAEGRVNVEDIRKAIAERDDAEKSKAEKAEKAAEAEAAKAKAAKKSEPSSSSSSSAAAGDDEKPSKAAERNAARMPERAHLDGCPMPADRIEIYDQDVPPKVRTDGAVEAQARVATMAHCVECGVTIEI